MDGTLLCVPVVGTIDGFEKLGRRGFGGLEGEASSQKATFGGEVKKVLRGLRKQESE